MADGKNEKLFSFNSIEKRQFSSLERKEYKENLTKWSMNGRLRATAFSFDQQFQLYEKDKFVKDFLADAQVRCNLQVLGSNEKLMPIGVSPGHVTVEHVPCSILSMDFFDRLYKHNIVRETGAIVKCFDEFIDDMTVADELRKMLLMEDSDNFDLYTEEERSEFLFRLFSHICLGGAVCQYEDVVEPYINLTKALYKDMLSVVKDSTGKLLIVSSVLKVTAKDAGQSLYFPDSTEHPQNFAYLIVDPVKRNVNVLYHKFGAVSFDN